MLEEPLVWHYGLIAETWAEFGVEPPELPYYQKLIQRHGQPVLDLACGTGRLLLPLFHGDYSEEEATADHKELVFIDRK